MSAFVVHGRRHRSQSPKYSKSPARTPARAGPHAQGLHCRVARTAGGIVPYCPRPRCKPDVKSVKEHPVRIVRVYGDSLGRTGSGDNHQHHSGSFAANRLATLPYNSSLCRHLSWPMHRVGNHWYCRNRRCYCKRWIAPARRMSFGLLGATAISMRPSWSVLL